MELYLTLWDVFRIFTVIVAMIVSHRLLARYNRRKKYRLPPGPVGLPLVGHVKILDHISLWDHRDKYGEISYLNVLGKDLVVLNSVDVIRDAFLDAKTSEVLSARPDSFVQAYIASEDIVVRSIDAENWKSMRMLFHSLLKLYGDGIDKIEGVVSTELAYLIERLRTTRRLKMQEVFQPSLLNILFVLLVGERFEYNSSIINDAVETVRLGNILSQPFVDLLLKSFPFLRFLPVGPGSVFLKQQYSQKRLISCVYEEHKTLPHNVLESRKGIVYDMMRHRETNSWINDSTIEGVILDTFGAGLVTTNSSLQFFFLILLHYPCVQTSIQDEIDRVVGSDRRPNVLDRSDMPYTVATILELSRYSSVAPMSVPHACSRDTTLRGFTIPRDSIIIPNLFRVNHDEKIWENPSDFNPRRFLDEFGSLLPASHPTRKNLIPFGVGKRACLGEKFAKTRLFLYITNLLQNFTFKPDEFVPPCHPKTFPLSFGIALYPPAFTVTIEPRK